MKIRSGFVANSSSSSFVITVPAEMYDSLLKSVAELIELELFDFKKERIQTLQNILDSIELYNSEDNKNNLLSSVFRPERKEKVEKELKEFEKSETALDILKTLLKVFCSVSFSEDCVEIKYFCTMFNNYNEALPFYLKELVLFSLGESIPILMKRCSDD